MRESSFYTRIRRYYEAHAIESMAWEAKFTRQNALPFDSLAPHQEEALLDALRCFTGKIADIGVAKKPFDGYVLVRATSVVIAVYYVARETEVYEIPIRTFLKEKHRCGRKSLTRDRAGQIGKKIII